MGPKFFEDQTAFRAWLQKNHAKVPELWVGYYKKATGIASITWPESVDEALCFGWIDGLRKSIDERSYQIRFTPRRPSSKWSDINIKRVKELEKLGKMTPAGKQAFARRNEQKSAQDSSERKNAKLSAELESKFKLHKKAWAFYQALAPSYRRLSAFWVMSAKRDETRLKRLDVLIESSTNGQKIPALKIGRK